MNPYVWPHKGKWLIGCKPMENPVRGRPELLGSPTLFWHGEAYRWQPGTLLFDSEQEATDYLNANAERMQQSFDDLRPDS